MLCLGVSLLLALAQSTTAPAPPAAQAAAPAALITPKDANERMELAERVNGLLGIDIPWHLKATYEVFGVDGKSTDTGTYEEWRVNAQQYRRAMHSPSLSIDVYGTEHGTFGTGGQDWPGRPLSLIEGMITRPITGKRDPEKTALQNYERNFGAGKLPCTAVMVRGSQQTAQDSTAFCFAPENAVLVYSSWGNHVYQTVFEHIVIAHGHYLAHDMQVLLGGRPWLKLHVDTLEGLGPAGLAAVPAGALPVSIPLEMKGAVTVGHLIKKAFPVYPLAAKQQGVEGTVLLDGIVGTDGRFKTLRVLTGPQMLQQAAIDAVRQWAYTPYLQDGRPVEVETDINVVFSLGR
jgi:TonB family protein